MKQCFLFIVLFSIFSFTSGQTQLKQINVMPYPAEVQLTGGEFKLDTNFTISISGPEDSRIYKASTRFLRRLDGRTGLFFKQDFITPQSAAANPDLFIKTNRKGELKLGEDESYKLEVKQNKITLTAPTDLGAMHGLETLLQLLEADSLGYHFPQVVINDAPRFPWRGLLIDVCRHFMPVEVIKRNLDGLAAVKMNVFHWHLSEDQGFRVETKVFPELHEMGSDGYYYTRAQIKDIIDYADARGIRVIPEFDVPGHATSWFVSHPELASAPGPYTIEREWGIMDPVFNPAIEETYEFLDKFFGEMASLFPDEYFHIGGDENNGKHWNANEDIQQFMKENDIEDNHALQAYFNNRILKILTKHGKKMVGWDEILHPDMPTDIVIQSWRGTESLFKSAQQGYMGILSNGYYIDLIQSAEYHYLNDPIPEESKLTAEEKDLILGGEATSWAELVTHETIDSRIWPRTAAIAERLWSPQLVTDVEDMYRRMNLLSPQMEELEITHIKNYSMMLRRLAGYRDIGYLRIFVDVVEPVKGYKRHFQGVKYYSYSPYTRVVDAARPESMTAREFDLLVEKYFETRAAAVHDKIKEQLVIWRDNHQKLVELIKVSLILKEIEPMSENLMHISEAGLEALEYLDDYKTADTEWYNEKRKLVEAARKPYGQVELVVVNPVNKLINAASGN